MTNKIRPAARLRRFSVAFGVLSVLAVPATAAANEKAPHDQKPASYKARGLVVATSQTTVTVCVGTAKKSTNKRAVSWKGQPVVFDVTSSKLKVRDIDGDGLRSLADVQIGDRVKVGAKLPRDLASAISPFAARKVAVDYKKKIKPKKGYHGGVCPEWVDDDEDEFTEDDNEDDVDWWDAAS